MTVCSRTVSYCSRDSILGGDDAVEFTKPTGFLL